VVKKGGKMVIEVFKSIANCSNTYTVSNYGRVYSNKRSGIYLKFNYVSGYPIVRLYTDTGVRDALVHRLVAETFLDGYFEGAEVNHIDEDKTNNHLHNLEWVTRQLNVEYSQSKYYLVTFPCNTEKVVYNLSKFCREHGLNQSNMTAVAYGRRKQHRGFTVELIGD